MSLAKFAHVVLSHIMKLRSAKPAGSGSRTPKVQLGWWCRLVDAGLSGNDQGITPRAVSAREPATATP